MSRHDWYDLYVTWIRFPVDLVIGFMYVYSFPFKPTPVSGDPIPGCRGSHCAHSSD